jgi:hypothetical protein
MRKLPIAVVIFSAVLAGSAFGQRVVRPLPKAVFAAKTVVILNNTHNEAVEQGALEALKRWGRVTVIDDADAADVVLTFDKKSEHEGTSSEKTGDDGKPSSNYSMSFSSSIHMRAVLKGSDSSFYTATTSESKKKAGAECITDLQAAYNSGP